MFVRSTPLLLACFILLHAGCSDAGRPFPTPRTGPWRMTLDLNGQALPFLFDLTKDDSLRWTMLMHNGTENIPVHDIDLSRDSIVIRMPLFDSEFRGVVRDDSSIVGFWHNHLQGPDYRIPFEARAGLMDRFSRASVAEESAEVGGYWETHFSHGSKDAYDAVGVFEQHGDIVTGTFETETGDYRFLEGVVHGDSLLLSCFDGSHAYLFAAALGKEGFSGRFWSGTHWQEPWIAKRNPAFRLHNADSLTALRPGVEKVTFRFPNLEGRFVSPSDPLFTGHPLMVQVMGSWCPNCVDEARLLKEMYTKYHPAGLEVIAVGFEKYEDSTRAIAGLVRFRNALDIEFPILYGGHASKDAAARKLPFLDHVMSYPTCIFIDRAGVVRRIRTGFYGPGTGEHYSSYKRDLELFIQQLLAEKAPS